MVDRVLDRLGGRDVGPLPEESRNCTGMICTFQSTPVTPIPLLPTAPISPAVNVPWPFRSIGLFVVVLTKFQPIRSSGCAVSPSWVEPLAQPPALVGASTSVPVMMPSPLVSTILPGPWLTGLFRSANVMTPSS